MTDNDDPKQYDDLDDLDYYNAMEDAVELITLTVIMIAFIILMIAGVIALLRFIF